MANWTREQRAEREAQRDKELDEARRSGGPFAGVAEAAQAKLDMENELDERKPNMRPGTTVNLETGEAAPDERTFPPDQAKALNQMAGRAVLKQRVDDTPPEPPPVVDVHGRPPGEGIEVRLLRGTRLDEGPKRLPGEVLRVPEEDAKRMIRLGIARRTEDE